MLAPKWEAEVHLLTRVFLHPLWHKLTEAEKKTYPESGFWEAVALRELSLAAEKFRAEKVALKTAYGPGDVVPLVQGYIADHAIDLLVMGTQGAKGMGEWLFGSNAQKVIRQATCPSIALKRLPEKLEFKRIVFATDYHELSEEALPFLESWAEEFDAEIHVVHVNLFLRGSLGEEELEWEALKGKSKRIRLHEVRDLSVEGGIYEAAKRLGADMVAVANYPDRFFQRILMGSVSEALLNHSDMPVLTIPVGLAGNL